VRTVVDYHRHFTGTLPRWFICTEALRRRAEPQVAQAVRKLVGDQVLTPESLRTACKRTLVQDAPAYLPFFDLYELIQAVTKPSENDYDSFYFRAGRAIAAQARKEHICACLIMGAHPDIDLLARRIKSTVRGTGLAGRLTTSMRIRVTFIRTPGGTFKNLSSTFIDVFFAHLERDAELAEHVVGLDFCGIECPQKPQPILDALEQIYTHNQHRASRRRRRLDISVHAGEDLVHSSPSDQLTLLEKLCTVPYGPQTIAHGTLLWIRAEDVTLDREQRRQRKACLRAMASREMALEICPTANLRMTPLTSRGHIPVYDLTGAGVRVRIGSDNPVLLGTTMRREIRHLRRDK
jgi:hypothetical protein